MGTKQALKSSFPDSWVTARKLFYLARRTLFSDQAWRILPEFRNGRPPTLSHATTQLCSASQFDDPEYARLASEICVTPRLHRKQWEYIFILAALSQSGVIRPCAKGLSFGAGREPMVAYFASKGCKIVATDMPPEMAEGSEWVQTNQYAAGKMSLKDDGVCDAETFDANVDFRFVDMNAVPDDLADFDFLWSSCALEHLGSLQHGLDFIKRTITCLRPGGVAVHTTEFNISSLDRTREDVEIVYYRKQDIDALIEDCAPLASISTPNWCCVSTDLDARIDRPPFESRPYHLKIHLGDFVATSLGIILRRN